MPFFLRAVGQLLMRTKSICEWVGFAGDAVDFLGVAKRVAAGVAIGTAVAGTTLGVSAVAKTVSNSLGSLTGSFAQDESTKFVGRWVLDTSTCNTLDITANGKDFIVKHKHPSGFSFFLDDTLSATLADGNLIVSGELPSSMAIEVATGNLIWRGRIFRHSSPGDADCK
jgi:hypothetical protein